MQLSNTMGVKCQILKTSERSAINLYGVGRFINDWKQHKLLRLYICKKISIGMQTLFISF